MAALGYLLVGSVSLGSARKAARQAKAEVRVSERTKASPALEERYLGHFGAGVRQSGAKKTSPALSKKTAAKKSGASKKAGVHVGKKPSSKGSSGATTKKR
jgi:hypothetical protein